MTLLNIYFLVQEFYAIEAISAMLSGTQGSNFEPMRHSHSRWYRDFTDFRNEYIIKFASAIYDYTVLVVAAEMRHCILRASFFINGYYDTSLSRDDVYKECFVYKADDILAAGIRMFDTKLVEWRRGFGGEKWKQIAKAGLMKGKVSDCVFIDHCVDLSHNNSIYFDKRAGLFYLQNISDYKNFLDLKRSCEPIALIDEKRGYAFNKLLWRARNLNIIDGPQADSFFSIGHDEAESLLFDYQPVKWGNKRLDFSESNIHIQRDFYKAPVRRVIDNEYDRDYGQAA